MSMTLINLLERIIILNYVINFIELGLCHLVKHSELNFVFNLSHAIKLH